MSVGRGAPSQMSGLALPVRAIRPAATAKCTDCHDDVPVRDGRLAGHYAVGRELCTGSSKPVSTDRKVDT
jgi:hypothetical protein